MWKAARFRDYWPAGLSEALVKTIATSGVEDKVVRGGRTLAGQATVDRNVHALTAALMYGSPLEGHTGDRSDAALSLAAWHGWPEGIQFLIRKCGASSDGLRNPPNEAKSQARPRPLGLVAMAASRGHLGAVDMLLECGVNATEAGERDEAGEVTCALQVLLRAAPLGAQRCPSRLAMWQVC